MLYGGMDKAGEFYKKMFQGLFSYVSYRIPEISDELYKIDAGLRAGFGWKMGPFEKWDAIGVEKVLADMDKAGINTKATRCEFFCNLFEVFNRSIPNLKVYCTPYQMHGVFCNF